MVGEAGREGHDRKGRVDGERSRDQRAVADVEPLDAVHLSVAVGRGALRVVAHPARALDVRRGDPGPSELCRARRTQYLLAELERCVQPSDLALVEGDVE